jgi:hypothetical protein
VELQSKNIATNRQGWKKPWFKKKTAQWFFWFYLGFLGFFEVFWVFLVFFGLFWVFLPRREGL